MLETLWVSLSDTLGANLINETKQITSWPLQRKKCDEK